MGTTSFIILQTCKQPTLSLGTALFSAHNIFWIESQQTVYVYACAYTLTTKVCFCG